MKLCAFCELNHMFLLKISWDKDCNGEDEDCLICLPCLEKRIGIKHEVRLEVRNAFQRTAEKAMDDG